MPSVSTRLQRAIVHRHTKAGRRFWAEVTVALMALSAEVEDAMLPLAALVREAADGPGTLELWTASAGPTATEALPAIRLALERFSSPRPSPASSIIRARNVVMNTIR